jgi:hypothetical protein
MIRRFVVLVAGVLALSVAAWYVNSEPDVEPEPRPPTAAKPTPSQADRLMAFCGKAANRTNPLCKVDPNDPEAVKDAVERIVQQAPQVIERERLVRDDEDDDGDESPDVNVIMPRPSPAATRRPTPTRTTEPPPLVPIEIPQIPATPDVVIPDLPVLN